MYKQIGLAMVSLALASTAQAYSIGFSGNSGGNPATSNVYQVTDLAVGDMFSVNWLLPANTQNSDNNSLPVALRATGKFTVREINNGSIKLGISLKNTTVRGSYGERLSLTALGLTTGNNTVDSARISGGTTFDGAATDNFPAFSTDACFFTGPNCAGGGNPGESLNPGGTDAFMVALMGDFKAGASITLDTFATKWQTGNGSYELAGSPVPLPGAVWLLGSGLLGVVGFGRRKLNAQAS